MKESDNMEISPIKQQFLAKIGVDINNLPEEFSKINLSYDTEFSKEEKRFLFSESFTKEFILPFCMKDIVGTEHPSYRDKTMFEAFLLTKRGDWNINNLYKNPAYYSETLKQTDQSTKTAGHDTPIELSRDSFGRCFISGGNNRLYILMMLYLKEFSDAKTESEKAAVNQKYTFYGSVKSLPKDRDVYNSIFLLEEYYQDDIKFSFLGTNPDDCHYKITINDYECEIKNVEELKEILKKAYALNIENTSENIYRKLVLLISIYINAKANNNIGKIKMLLEICPSLEELKQQFLTLRRITLSDDVFEDLNCQMINYDNINTLLSEIIKREEMKLANQDSEGAPKL